MLIKTSDLIGHALNYAVAIANGWRTFPSDSGEGTLYWYMDADQAPYGLRIRIRDYAPSFNWDQAGRIIEQIGGFQLKIWLESSPYTRCEAHIHNYEGDWIAFGAGPLIAAMRCYVASKLGDEVEIPDDYELEE